MLSIIVLYSIQREKTVPAYAIVRATITDPERFKDYASRTPALLAKHGAKFLVRGGDIDTLEGETETRRIVVIEYESREKALEFYHSEEYAELLAIMKEAGTREFIVVDGV